MMVNVAEAGEGPPAWKIEWGKTLQAAKKEGQVTIYGSRGFELIVNEGEFQKAYPEIKVVTFSAETGDFLQRLLSERRAGKYLADLAIGSADSPYTLYESKFLDAIVPALILPEVLDASKWWRGKHHYNDPEKRYIFQYIGSPNFGSIYYNSTLVDPKEFTSFWDFVNPKWKGKIAFRDVRIGGSGATNIRFFYHNHKLGPDFIRRLLSEMDVTLFRDARQSVDWLASGKFPLCFFCVSSQVGRARQQGLPIEQFGQLKEGAALQSQSGSIGLMKDAPHPAAAKVFLNWLLSREGQITMQKSYVKAGVGASNSFRIDIPKDILPPHQRLYGGVDYFEIEELPETRDMQPVIDVMEAALKEAEAKRQKSR
jgi:iron(III) transport system substrate-binding protein